MKKEILLFGIGLIILFIAGCNSESQETVTAILEAAEPIYLGEPANGNILIERVTTMAPFPRGLDMVDGKLYVLCRGRVRGAGGVTAQVEDQAGTLYVVDPEVTEPFKKGDPSEKIMTNGEVFALPTSPPFNLWDRSASPPEKDRETDRPYCTLRYHDATKSFYLCAFSGIDKPKVQGQSTFSKNLTDALFRYDIRTSKWYEVERHDLTAGGSYPHNDPKYSNPPHGWLNGADNCLAVGNYLYAVAKDNSVLIRYDLSELVNDPEAGYPKSEFVLGEDIYVKGKGMMKFLGHSALAIHNNFLYIGSRTSSLIIRTKIDEDGMIINPYETELVAKFQPYEPETGATADITDMAVDSKGRIYVISAQPARIFRFLPNPDRVYDANNPDVQAWADLAAFCDVAHVSMDTFTVDLNFNYLDAP